MRSRHIWRGDGRRRLAAFGILTLTGLLAHSACQGNQLPAANRIRIGISSDVVTLNPHGHDDGVTWGVQANIYEGLVAFDAQLRIVPCLATKWENPDSTTWRFYLRSDVTFHDGRPMRVLDVLYSIRHALQDTTSQIRSKLAGVREVTAYSEGGINIRTGSPDPVILNKLVDIYIVPEGAFMRREDNPPGTGPYVLEAWKRAGTVYLRRFSGYWGPRPTIERAVFVPLRDQLRRAEPLFQGKIDLVNGLTADDIATIMRRPDLKMLVTAGTTVSYLGYRCGGLGNPFDDRRFRQAIYLAIDVERIIRETFHEYGEPANQPVPPAIFGYNPSLPKRSHDQAHAQALIAEMGGPPQDPLILHMPENAVRRVGPHLQRDLEQIGLTVRVQPHAWKDFYRKMMNGDLGFYLSGWSCGSGDASDFYDACIHARTGGFGEVNVGNCSDRALDLRIERSHTILNAKERLVVLKGIMETVMEELPVIPVYYINEYNAASRKVVWTPRADDRVLVREIKLGPW
ncbi:MAG: hypothetical protein HYX75_18930 [Acidobacteria bacterium]|nr:hypothetical protein [Acidobacteriota bacterium]